MLSEQLGVSGGSPVNFWAVPQTGVHCGGVGGYALAIGGIDAGIVSFGSC